MRCRTGGNGRLPLKLTRKAMRTNFFEDPRGNIQAFEACLKLLKCRKPECLGDLAGWLPFG